MDKVKHYLAIAGKHHFWILCAIVALLTLGSWYTSTADLRAEFQAKKSKITEAETKAAGVRNEPNHPNEEYSLEMNRMISAYKANLRELWKAQYEAQGKNLQWPVEKPGFPGLTEEFVEQVKDLRPIETAVPYDPTSKGPDVLKGNFKDQYRNFVKSTELPRLAEIIDAKWYPAEMGNAGGFNRAIGGEEVQEGTVEWHAENQEYLQNTRFDWSKEQGGLPTTLQILYAQEDLWVLGTLINIIAKTNQGADARHNAVVKEIKYLKLGSDAVGFSGEVIRLAPPEAVPGAPGAPVAGAPAPLMPAAPVPGAPGVPGMAPVVRDPAEGRYVDDKYQPVPPGRLRDAFSSNKPEEAFLAVAKRMPVRMHLVIDQRYINRLLAECGNSNLIVEIRQVRVNRPVFEGGGLPGAAGGPGAVFAPRGGGEQRGFNFGPQPRPAAGGRESSGITGEEKPRHEIDIELYGIVYIYNPVNENMVSAVADAGATSPLPTTPPVAPVAPTTPPADGAPVAPPVAPPMNTQPAPAPVAPPAVEPMPAPVPMPVAPPPAAPGA